MSAVLLLIASWRLDQAVRTAYKTQWVAPQFELRRQTGLVGECSRCWRLPSDAWIWGYALIGVIAIALLVVALWLWCSRRFASNPAPAALTTAVQVTMLLSTGLAILAAVFRWFAGAGYGSWLVGSAIACSLVALGLLALASIAVANVVRDTDPGASLLGRVRRVIQRQRINILGVTALALTLTVVPQTSGQAIDSIRSWSFFASTDGAARLTFGIATALLLALVVYESALRLSQCSSTSATNPGKVPLWVWLTVAAVLLVLGVLGLWLGPFGWGLIVLGGVALLLALLELPKLPGRMPTTIAPVQGTGTESPAAFPYGSGVPVNSGLAVDEPHDDHAPEYLAIVPLLAIAAVSIAAALDAALSGGVNSDALAELLPALLLGGAAVLMTAERPAERLDPPSLRAGLLAVGLVVVLALVLVGVVRTRLGAVLFGLAACVALVALIVLRFRVHPARTDRDAGHAYSLPLALGAGLALFLAVNGDVYGSSDTIGTFALVNIALAFILAAMHFAVRGSLLYRPPRLLWWFGFEQLPIVSLVLVCWIATGAIGSPETLHEVRLVDREAVAGEIRAAPTLAQAFEQWRRAQPELVDSAKGTPGQPVPLVLVAAHGGGIRAAYWTALALDCIVGVSTDGVTRDQVVADDPESRKTTCSSPRRTAAGQEQAARRVFLGSGVSGGAMGLYAYARRLLVDKETGGEAGAATELEGKLDGQWVGDELGQDYASAMVSWSLFHDVPNRVLGLNPHRDGSCGWKLLGVCMTDDRAAVLEEDFDRAWPASRIPPYLRLVWDLRSSGDPEARRVAETVPVVLTNATVTGGKARGVVSALDLGSWPLLETDVPSAGGTDAYPLAGTVEVSNTLCTSKDIRLSSAAFLGSRFPYVSPSGHLSGHCRRSLTDPLSSDAKSKCALVAASTCETRLVDGGYADNSGLFTIDAIWPALRKLIVDFNASSNRKIAPVIVELDNHYQALLASPLPASGQKGESLIPIVTGFGARNALQTFAQAAAYRLLPADCVVTIAPGLHPGLTAPLGWELSTGAKDDLREALVRPHPAAIGALRNQPVYKLRRLQEWLGSGNETRGPALIPALSTCVPA